MILKYFTIITKPLAQRRNNGGPKTDACGTPHVHGETDETALLK